MPTEQTLNVRFTHTNEDTSIKSIYYPETTVDQVHGLKDTITVINNNINSHASSIKSNYDSICALNDKDSVLTTAYNNATLAVASLQSMADVATKTIAIPEQSAVLIYDHGKVLTPSWNNYEPKKETITGGTTSHSLAGSYTVQFTTGQYYYPNGQKTIIVGWDIDKYTMAEPVLQNTSFEYNTSLQSIAFSSSTVGYSVGGDISKSTVGSYEVSIKPIDKNYQWVNGTSEIKKINWSIVSKGGLQVPYQANPYIYTGDEKNITKDQVLINYESDKMSIGGVSAQSLAGTYTASVSIRDTLSYKWSDGSSTVKSFKWTINPSELNPNSLELKTNEYEYTAAGVTITSKDFNGFDTNKMSISGGNKATAIGSNYKVSVDAKPNYVWMNGSTSLKSNIFTWSIIETKLTDYPSLKQTLYSYNNIKYRPELTNSYGISVSGDLEKSLVGTYTISASPSGNNSWPDGTTSVVPLEWKIEPKSINTPKQATVPSYTTGVHSIVSYINNYNNSEISIGGTATAKAAGTYSAKMKLKSTANLRWLETNDIAEKTLTWTIKNAAIAPPTLKVTEFDYKANTTRTISFSNTSTVGFSILPGSETVGTNVKVYKMSVAPAKNYEWNTSKNKDKIYTLTWEISSDSVFAVPIQKSIPPYSGSEISVNNSSAWTGYNTKYLSIGGTFKGTNAGTYNAIFKLKDTNYSWEDGTKTNKTVNWTIGKQTISPSMGTTFFQWKSGTTVTPTIGNSVGASLSGTTSSKDRGYFTITAAPKANYAFEKNATSKKFTWTLASVLANPGFVKGVTKYEYNPSGTTVSLASTVGVAIAGSLKATTRGSYHVTVTPNTLFAWNDGTRTPKTLTWKIVQKSIATNISLNKTSLPYNGNKQAVSVKDSTTAHSIGGSLSGTDVREYTVSIKPANTNYVWSGTTNSTSIKTLKWSITPQKLTVPAVTASKIPTYNNSTTTSLVSLLNSNYDSTKMVIGGTTTLKVPTVATAKFSLRDTRNYVWSDNTTADKSLSWSIKVATIPANVTITANLTYNEDLPNIRIHDFLTPTISSKLIYVDNVNDYVHKTVAGSFVTTIKPYNTSYVKWSDGTTSSKTIKWTVKPQTIKNPQLVTSSFEYNASNKTVSLGDYWKTRAKITGGTSVAANVGKYSVYVTPNSNYAWSDGKTTAKTVTWTISNSDNYKYNIPSFKTDAKCEYKDGAVINVSQTTWWNNYDSTKLSIGGVVTAKAASVYTAKFALRNTNYLWTDGSKTVKSVTWTVKPKTIAAPSINKHDFAFNPSAPLTVTTILSRYDSKLMNLSGTTISNNNTTKYTVSVALKDKKNYIWSDSNNTTDKKIPWEIKKATVTAPSIKNNNNTVIWDGTVKHISMVTGIYGIYNAGNMKYINLYNETSKNAGVGLPTEDYTDEYIYTEFSLKYPNCSIWDNGKTQDITMKWGIQASILPSVITPKLAKNSFVYNATFPNNKSTVETTYNISLDSSYSPNNNCSLKPNNTSNSTVSATKANTYKVKVYAKNYPNVLFTGKKEFVTLSWTINPKTVTPDVQDRSFTYKPNTKHTINLTSDTERFAKINTNAGKYYETSAGTYTVYLSARPNYVLSFDSLKWTINPAIVTPKLTKDSFPYDGSVHEVSLDAASSIGASLNTKSEYRGTDAKKYTVQPVAKTNYKLSNTNPLNWTITAKTITITPKLDKDIYQYNNDQEYTVKLSSTTSLYGSLSGDTIAYNEGTYAVQVQNKPNYVLSKRGQLIWTIKPMPVTPKLSISSFTYKEGVKHTVDLDSSSSKVASFKTGTRTASLAGSYTVGVIGKFNYSVKAADSVLSWKINPATVTPGLASYSFPYTGDKKTVNLNAKSSIGASLKGITSATVVGTYSAIPDAKPNYVLNNTAALKWTINPATVTPSLDSTKILYNGSNQTVKLNAKSSIGASLTGTTSAKNVGTYSATPSAKPNYVLSSTAALKWEIYQNDLPTVKIGNTTYTADKFIEATPSIKEGPNKNNVRDTFVWYVKLIPNSNVNYKIDCSGNCFYNTITGANAQKFIDSSVGSFDSLCNYAIIYRMYKDATEYKCNWTITAQPKNNNYKAITKTYSMDTTKGISVNRNTILNSLSWYSISQYVKNNRHGSFFEVGDRKEITFVNNAQHELKAYSLHKPNKMQAIIVHKNYHPEKNDNASNKKYNLYFGIMGVPSYTKNDKVFAMYGDSVMSYTGNTVTVGSNSLLIPKIATNNSDDYNNTFIDDVIYKIRDDYLPTTMVNVLDQIHISSASRTKASHQTRKFFPASINEIYGKTNGRAIIDAGQFDFFKTNSAAQTNVYKAPTGNNSASTVASNQITAWLRDGVYKENNDGKFARFACFGNDTLKISDRTVKHIFFHESHSSCAVGDGWYTISLGIIPFFAIQ